MKSRAIPKGVTGGSSAIPCENCGDLKSAVIDGRNAGAAFRRRRVCLSCSHRFTTFELCVDSNGKIERRDFKAAILGEIIGQLQNQLANLQKEER